MNTIAPFY